MCVLGTHHVIRTVNADLARNAEPIPVAERPKVRVCGRSLAGIEGSNPAWGIDVCVVCVLCNKDKKPGQSRKRCRDKVQSENKESRFGHGCLSRLFVV